MHFGLFPSCGKCSGFESCTSVFKHWPLTSCLHVIARHPCTQYAGLGFLIFRMAVPIPFGKTAVGFKRFVQNTWHVVDAQKNLATIVTSGSRPYVLKPLWPLLAWLCTSDCWTVVSQVNIDINYKAAACEPLMPKGSIHGTYDYFCAMVFLKVFC